MQRKGERAGRVLPVLLFSASIIVTTQENFSAVNAMSDSVSLSEVST